jgi:hypothetical protein
LVKCSCGKEKEVYSYSLLSGFTISCGCYTKERTSQRFKIEYGLSAKRSIYDRYKQQAKRRNGLAFELNFEQFIELTQQNCYYCGSEPSNLFKDNGNGSFKYNGIDRVDNNKGYILSNCVSCCDMCNKSKRNNSYEKFFEWGIRLGKHLEVLNESSRDKRLRNCYKCRGELHASVCQNYKPISQLTLEEIDLLLEVRKRSEDLGEEALRGTAQISLKDLAMLRVYDPDEELLYEPDAGLVRADPDAETVIMHADSSRFKGHRNHERRFENLVDKASLVSGLD